MVEEYNRELDSVNDDSVNDMDIPTLVSAAHNPSFSMHDFHAMINHYYNSISSSWWHHQLIPLLAQNKKISLTFLVGFSIWMMTKLIIKYGLMEGLAKYKNFSFYKSRYYTHIKSLGELQKKNYWSSLPPLDHKMTLIIKLIDDKGRPINYLEKENVLDGPYRLQTLWRIIDNTMMNFLRQNIPDFKVNLDHNLIIHNGQCQVELDWGHFSSPQSDQTWKSVQHQDFMSDLINELKKAKFIPSSTPSRGGLSRIQFIQFIPVATPNHHLHPELIIQAIY